MSTLREEIGFLLQFMGFDINNVMLNVPLQAIWLAVESIEQRKRLIVPAQSETTEENLPISQPAYPEGVAWLSNHYRKSYPALAQAMDELDRLIKEKDAGSP